MQGSCFDRLKEACQALLHDKPEAAGVIQHSHAQTGTDMQLTFKNER